MLKFLRFLGNKWIVLIVGPFLVVSMGVFLDRQSGTHVERIPREKPTKIFATGRIEGADQETALRFEISGKITRINIKTGDKVKRGDVLAELDDSEYRQRLLAAQSTIAYQQAQLVRLKNGAHQLEIEEAKAQLTAKSAERDYYLKDVKRKEELLKSRAVSFDEYQSTYAQAKSLLKQVEALDAHLRKLQSPAREDEIKIIEAQIAVAEAEARLAKVTMEKAKMVAPIDGTITFVGKRVGESYNIVEAMPDIVLRLVDDSRLRVRAFAEEEESLHLRPNLRTYITVDGKTVTGRVTQVSPRMQKKDLFNDHPSERIDVLAREVWIDLDGSEKIPIGLRVDVIIERAD